MQEENFSIPETNAGHYGSTPDDQLCFILALKVCKGAWDMAHNIHEQAAAARLLLILAPRGSWGRGRKVVPNGDSHLHVSAHTVRAPITRWQTVRGTLTGYRRLADATHKCFTLAWRRGKGVRWGPGLTARLDQGQGGKYRSHGSSGGGKWEDLLGANQKRGHRED